MALYDFISSESCKRLLKVMRDNKWGLIKESDYTEVVEPIWDSEPNFNFGHIIVKHQNKYGAIDENGNEIIPISYQHLEARTRKRIWACTTEDKVGILDAAGNVLVPLKYSFLQWFDDGHIVVGLEKTTGMIDINNDILLPFEYTYIIFNPRCSMFECKNTNGMYGLINMTMEEVVPYKYNTLLFYNSCIVAVEGDKKAVYDFNGNKLVDSVKCKRIYPAGEGYFVISNENNLQGIIKSDGSVVVEPMYEEIKYLGEGLFAACKQIGAGPCYSRVGMIDCEGKEILPFEYTSAEEFKNGISKVVVDGKMGAVNAKGKEVIPFKYTSLKYTGEEKYVVAKKGEMYGIISSKGKELTPFIYSKVFDVRKHGFATVEYNGMRGEVIL